LQKRVALVPYVAAEVPFHSSLVRPNGGGTMFQRLVKKTGRNLNEAQLLAETALPRKAGWIGRKTEICGADR
jgi:hypothetical protein